MRIAFLSCLILVLTVFASAQGGDWPQILGPGRNGVAVDEQIADSWPAAGPATLWHRDAGERVCQRLGEQGHGHPLPPHRR